MRLIPPSLSRLRRLVSGDLTGAARELGLAFSDAPWPDDAEMRDGLAVHLTASETHPVDLRWRVFLIATDDGRVLGHAGFKGAPGRAREVEIYWCVEPPFRRHGVASLAAASLCGYAFDSGEVAAVVATISPANIASQRVALRLGMHRVPDEYRHGLPLWRLEQSAWAPGLSLDGRPAARIELPPGPR